MKKVGLITEYPPYQAGMISRKYLFEELKKYHHIQLIKWNDKGKVRRIFSPLLRLIDLTFLLQSNDVIQIEYEPASYQLFFLPTIALLNLFYKKKIIVRVHETLDHKFLYPLYKYFHDFFFAFFDIILTHTEHHKSLLGKNIRRKTLVLHHGVKINDSLLRNPVKGKLLMLGFIHARKGCEIAIKAMAHLKEYNYKLYIIGKSQNSKYLKFLYSLIDELDLKNNVIIKDKYISEEEVNHQLKTCDIMLLPYRRITMSGILTHCISHLIPSVISSFPQIKSIMGKSVLYFQKNSEFDLVDKILTLEKGSNRENLIDELSKLKRKYSWSVIGRINAKIIQDL